MATEAMTSAYSQASRSRSGPDLVDTDEVGGSIQAAPFRPAGSTRGAKLDRTSQIDPGRPTHAESVTSAYRRIARSQRLMILVRDEEAVGSNPATPTSSGAVFLREDGPCSVPGD
jgi:hypothetical protein